MSANASPSSYTLADAARVTLWFAPQRHPTELSDVGRRIDEARSGILFALGPRGRSDPLVERIEARARALYVTGISRSTEGMRVSVCHHATKFVVNAERPPEDVLKIAGLKISPSNLPVGSRLIVIDPFGDDPVVITGSHTLSVGASRKNDEDLLIICGNRALAEQCAVHIKGLVAHYMFRVRSASSPTPVRLSPNGNWQSRFRGGEAAKEIAFWMNTLSAANSVSPSAGLSSIPKKQVSKTSATRKTKKSTERTKGPVAINTIKKGTRKRAKSLKTSAAKKGRKPAQSTRKTAPKRKAAPKRSTAPKPKAARKLKAARKPKAARKLKAARKPKAARKRNRKR
jgi:hypothetical protein